LAHVEEPLVVAVAGVQPGQDRGDAAPVTVGQVGGEALGPGKQIVGDPVRQADQTVELGEEVDACNLTAVACDGLERRPVDD
jgi:hypothetical protein